MNQAARAQQLRALHQGPTFILANAWSAGSAKHLAAMGFRAIGTTSGGLALDMGLRDGEVGAKGILASAAAIASAVDVPVSADLENGFGDSPEACVATVMRAISLGLAGGSIEDSTGRPDEPIYPFDIAVARIRAVVNAVRESGQDFVLTARAENFLHGRRDLDDTLARLKAYEAAGADVLFAPGLPDLPAIRAVRAGISKPMNVLIAYDKAGITVQDLAAAGVNRVSLGSGLTRAAFRGMEEVARQYLEGPGR